jgi:hypothetical protein
LGPILDLCPSSCARAHPFSISSCARALAISFLCCTSGIPLSRRGGRVWYQSTSFECWFCPHRTPSLFGVTNELMAGFGTNRCTPVREILDRRGYEPPPPLEVERARLSERQRGSIRVDRCPCPSKYASDTRSRRRCRGCVALASPVYRISPPPHHRARRCGCQGAGPRYGETQKALASEPACRTRTPLSSLQFISVN